MLGLRTSTRAHGRTRRASAAALCALIVLVGATGCTGPLSWKLGQTHGAVAEPGARRASLVIYRVPRRRLYEVYERLGTRAAQDALWAAGQPPVTSLRVGKLSISTAALNEKIRGYIYGDPADFRGALLDAQRNRNCLALTLISQGLYIKNWTHKSAGCQLGSM